MHDMTPVKDWFIQHISWRRFWLVGVFLIVCAGIFFGALIAYGNAYTARVLPGVFIGDMAIGGLDEAALRQYLESMYAKLSDQGIGVVVKGDSGQKRMTLYPAVLADEDVLEFFDDDIQKEVNYFLSYRKKGNILVRGYQTAYSRLIPTKTHLQYVVPHEEYISDQLEAELKPLTQEPRNASLVIQSLDPLSYTMVTSSVGHVFDTSEFVVSARRAWASLKQPVILLASSVQEPAVIETDVLSLESSLPSVLSQGSLTITYTDSHTKWDRSWVIDEEHIAAWIDVQKNESGDFGFGLSASSTRAFLEQTVAAEVNKEAQNAKFSIGETGKVTEFQGSSPGIALQISATYHAINAVFLQRSGDKEGVVTSVGLVVEQTEPDIKTGEVNDLGIEEALGVGYSNFSGSPVNRVKNIRHAVVNKLNGILIQPDETFSLLNALRPLTIGGGYLPELVIKGDKIIPEVGGGLCQIGSTMFRTAMNAAMPIVERRNHSLVVRYYNDPRNDNPGTDATIYDPAPDFRFHNDTGKYMLLTTEMNEKNGDLFFTLWGTNDGRKGSYSEPVVKSWIPAGEPRVIETTDMKPGEENCQSAHSGAVASFVYTRVLPDGQEEERVFESHYRALPKICLVGVESIEEAPSSDGAEEVSPLPEVEEPILPEVEEGSPSAEASPTEPIEE
ncbi:MAG TPA: hypothetical protein DCY48_02890 [Candidatus Magasanikbacteria bacterium]|nr:MAG: hypothetical protein A3I74_03550 [Candidatus Magasanikbacteria bacterium RIFCSPLOWO2_02_FULL_47_16]OGH80274.1 MAG: hypothetical protein A3C10_03830 [Candidatus Magasanikbacteria bacterium RIFCSPHIGHO2_02_FULL_48_18]HAZ28696.1 hypothetical protein [Candidatus Magasanikbacteria bacterium]